MLYSLFEVCNLIIFSVSTVVQLSPQSVLEHFLQRNSTPIGRQSPSPCDPTLPWATTDVCLHLWVPIMTFHVNGAKYVSTDYVPRMCILPEVSRHFALSCSILSFIFLSFSSLDYRKCLLHTLFLLISPSHGTAVTFLMCLPSHLFIILTKHFRLSSQIGFVLLKFFCEVLSNFFFPLKKMHFSLWKCLI